MWPDDQASTANLADHFSTLLGRLNALRQEWGIPLDDYAARIGWSPFEVEAALHGALQVDSITAARFGTELVDLMLERAVD